MRDPILGKLIVRPGRAMRDIIAAKPLLGGLVVFLLGSLSVAAGFFLEVSVSAEPKPGTLAAMILPAVLILGLLKLFYWTGAIHLMADLLGGAGRGLALLVCVMYTALPAILAAPLAWASRAALGPAAWIGLLGGSALMGLWVVVLQLVAIREVYRFTWARALSTWLLPVAILLVLLAGPILALLGPLSALLGHP